MEVWTKGAVIETRDRSERLRIEPWGPNGIRVRMARGAFSGEDWALTEPVSAPEAKITEEEIDTSDPWYRGPEYPKQHRTGRVYALENGKITARLNEEGWISFENARGETLLKECWQNNNRIHRYSLPTNVPGRELRSVPGTSDHELFARFEADDREKIFGMGQYQTKDLDRKGMMLELMHRNSQSSVPFYVSNLGYGFLWNNPGVGTVSFAKNLTEWHLPRTDQMDYYIVAGDSPAEILSLYSAATGRSPDMPEYGLGYWQCRLRYRTQEEVLSVAREMKRRGLPLDVIVIDFFHWKLQGDWDFDPACFPDPAAMAAELRSMGVETCVSVWPTVDARSASYPVMREKGLLMEADRGRALNPEAFMGPTVYVDATNPEAMRFVFDKCRKSYLDRGIRLFWLDEAEPEIPPYEMDNWRYAAGPALKVSNVYPREYARGFWEGLKGSGQEEIISLVRCAWAGSQKYGALAWSGDVSSTWRAFREQLSAGLSMGMAGIPWWTCDLGGFNGGWAGSADFRELLARWFAWGCFLPVFRMHGARAPWFEDGIVLGPDGIQILSSGAPNELWSFGEETYGILSRYLFLREKLRPYLRRIFRETSETGAPVMRPLFFQFPEDPKAWETENAYLLGPDVLVSPVTEPGVDTWDVYLPAGADWIESATGRRYPGGQTVSAAAPLDVIPVFLRAGTDVTVY